MAQENTARVITIAATEQPQDIRLRVAAYARVSSSSEEQLNSFAAQNRYYTEFISGKDNWQLVDIYADEGITGTSIEKRDDFKRMLRDCERGLIDMILVKSISRFARNTTECLETVRSLKARGVSVYFEKEGIDTGKVSGEMLTAVFASLAQAESESISKNMRWSYQKRMQMGTYIPSSMPYGYALKNGEITIDPEEAAVVREIYDMYLSGIGIESIVAALRMDGKFNRKSKPWGFSSIQYILSNEKYTGDSIWRKTYQTETLPRKQKTNRGELEKYFAQGSHPAIISHDKYNAVQRLRKSRGQNVSTGRGEEIHELARNTVCGHCGAPVRTKANKGNVCLVCTHHAKSSDICPTGQIRIQEIEEAFIRLCYKLKHAPEILQRVLGNLYEMTNHRMLWSPDVIELNKRISDILTQNQMLAVLKQQGLVDTDIFISKTNELAEQLRKLKLKKERLLEAKTDDTLSQTKQIMEVIRDAPDCLEEFDAELFGELIDKIIVEDNTHLRFRLKNGLELRETIRRAVR